MLKGQRILIAEDEPFIAMDLASGVEEARGHVVGPAASVSEALALLAVNEVSGAILDVNLADRDVTPVALMLIEKKVPIVFHTGVGIPPELAMGHPNLVVCIKPTSLEGLIAHLKRQLNEFEQ